MVQARSLNTSLLLFITLLPFNTVIADDSAAVGASGIDYSYIYGEVCPQVPSLRCQNGSTCRPGAAAFGKKHDHLDLQTQESGYYCDCKPGFIGHECEIQAKDCEDGLHSCYHGSSCRANDDGVSCDCDTLNEDSGPTDAKFAGSMCQHESTSMCAVSLVGSHAPNHQFCTNHGECFKMVTGGEPHPGCICKGGWTGDHCEIRQDPFAPPRLQESLDVESSSSGAKLWGLWLTLIAVAAVAAALMLLLMRNGKTRNTRNTRVAYEKDHPKLSEGNLDADGSGTLGSRAEVC